MSNELQVRLESLTYERLTSTNTISPMDSKHRHELQENVLASWLQQKLDSTQAQLPVIAAGLVAVVIAYAGWSLLAQTRESGRAAAWENYTLAIETGSPSLEMLDLAAEDPNPDVANLARITWADGQLQQGSAKYFFDRTAANQALDKAQEAYDKMLKSSDPVMVNRASVRHGPHSRNPRSSGRGAQIV